MTKLYYHMLVDGVLCKVCDVNLPSVESYEQRKRNRAMVENNQKADFWIHLEQNEQEYIDAMQRLADENGLDIRPPPVV